MYKALTMTTHDVAPCACGRRRSVGRCHRVDREGGREAACRPAMAVDHFRNAVPAASGNRIDLVGRWLPFLSGEGEAAALQPDTRARSVPEV